MGQTDQAAVSRLTLDAALLAAENDNIDVLRSRLAIRTAEANRRIADTAPNPNLNLTAVQIRPNLIGSRPIGQLADTLVSVDMVLERGGKRRARTAAASALLAASRTDLAATRRDIREAIFDSYFDLKAAEQRVDLLGKIAASYDQGLQLASLKTRTGALSGADLARQKVEASRAKTDLQQAQTDLRSARLVLATLVGQERIADTLATGSDWPAGDAGGQTAPADLLALQRPEVLSAQSRLSAAQRSLDGANALRKQDVTVTLQYERAPASLGIGSSVGFGLSVPLAVRNRYRGEIDAAGTQLVQAEAELRKATAVATADIMIARNAYQQAAMRRRTIEDEQLPAARHAAQIAEFAYGNGATSLLELLDARRSLRAVELDTIDARNDEAHALARLNAAQTTADDN
ncbi:TolC family protein [Novosphingobium sp.]|uniref:TolC family protein n=1 Tax=Novosphingobium sp. TaxID=1874826 RepID=UPI001D37673C|nr:TolC family protein [Novosphingobium sp.]MBX9663742.1 TolC family protein [Novosphingobium sp.]